MSLLTVSWAIYGVGVVLSIFIVSYLFMTRNFGYWKKRGVLELPPIPFVGNFLDCCRLKSSVPEFLQSVYELGKGLPYVGIYLFDKPILVLRDPEVFKSILIKDFEYFANRYASGSDTDIVGASNLFHSKTPKWKSLRNKLTSVFSSGKMKAMFPLVTAIGDDLTDHLESLDLQGGGQIVELKEICSKFTTDVIGSCVFGLRVNSLNNPDAAFRECGKKIFEVTYMRGLELMSIFFVPGIVKPLGFKIFGESSEKFLRTVFWDTFNERVKSGLRRNDLVDLLIELKGNQTDDDDPHAFKFEGDHLVAQASVFFAAGFETSSTMMSYTLHELSLYPDIQTKLRHEINTAMEENGGKLSYDLVQQLPYLDKIACETLRKYPSVPFLDRVTSRDYTIPKTGLVIEKGTPIYIPLLGLHHDPEYFPDPKKYEPERFSKEEKQKRQPFVYLPFGDGPRNCIGLRFGLMQAKVGIIKVISNYEISPCEKTPDPVEFEPKAAVILTSKSGLYHRVRQIRTTSVG